jgi:hypothetical protein
MVHDMVQCIVHDIVHNIVQYMVKYMVRYMVHNNMLDKVSADTIPYHIVTTRNFGWLVWDALLMDSNEPATRCDIDHC